MQKDLISVIIPVYNAEKYINRCIDSVLNQSHENLEVILVDDGSTDGSTRVYQNWAKEDKRVKVIRQENAGTSAARNTGIKAATGNYISFVDNDDWLRPEMYETILKEMHRQKADLGVCKFINVDENYKKIQFDEINLSEENIKNPGYYFLSTRSKTKHEKIIGCCNRLLVKRDLLKDLEFDTSLSYGENILFVLKLIEIAKNVAVVNEYLYNHFDDSNIKVYETDYLADLEAYHTALCKFFESRNQNFSYLADHDFIHKVIKANIKKKHFAKRMNEAIETSEKLAEALSKSTYKKVKDLGFGSAFQHYLIYHKKWNLLKLFFK